VQLSGHYDVPTSDPQALMEAVAQQPVAVSIEADRAVFQSYTSGIISSTSCGQNTDHCVLVVGYGNDDGIDYWLLKNSWGTSWGEDGFFRILRDMASTDWGICGLQRSPAYPIV